VNWRITFYNKKVILNAFVKKKQKSPKKELALARKRMKEVLK